MTDLLSVVLAAGQGTRMKSDLTKVLHKVAGEPMLKYILRTTSNLASHTVCVVGYQGEQVKEEIDSSCVDFVEQEEQLGTAHAVRQAREYIKEHDGPVLILYGDTPLLTENTLQKMVKQHQKNKAGLTVLTAYIDEPTGYGRIIRSQDEKQITEIVEEEDADETEKSIKEINSGVYCFDSNLLVKALENINCDNAQEEYYLTDAVSYINKQGNKVIPVVVEDSKEIIGINNRVALSRAEKILRQRINNYHMENGVTIIDPETTYIDSEVEIERDTVIYPFTYLEGKTKIKKDCVIGPHCRLVNIEIGNCTQIKANCVLRNSLIEDNCTIGPFAYIRPGSKVNNGAKVGDFVELKKSNIGRGTKVPHLSYVGDAEIGEGSNIGAGTIFANYDGEKEHRTTVGNSVFIGSNTTLVAPVNIGNDGKTGAGSVVTKNVDKNTTVVGVPARIYKKESKENEL